MGILDDAIRQHLDLKRQRGATESELKQLEDEAFGPPSRPGAPDFPESGEVAQQSGNGNGSASGSEPSQAAEAVADTGEAEVAMEPDIAEPPIVEEEPQAAEEAPGSEDPTTFYDHTAGGETHDQTAGDAAHDEPPSDEAPASHEGDAHEATEPEAAADPPVESLDTVEHPAPFDVVEDEAPVEDAALVEAEPESDDESDAAEDEGEATEIDQDAEDEDSDDDVLADTPEFLRDAPEDDELWFEQGKPKDFDF